MKLEDEGMELTHFNPEGRAQMVDVSAKEATFRVARAAATVRMAAATAEKIRAGQIGKGDVLAVAQVAGIMAAKKNSELIPMCHPLMLTKVDLRFSLEETALRIFSEVRCRGETGVEMEALTAVSVAALTVYDMCKAVQKDMEITDIRLLYKEGGKSGVYRREGEARVTAVNISERRGTPKHPVPYLELRLHHGIVGDAHAGDWHRQISLLAEESVDKMRAMGKYQHHRNRIDRAAGGNGAGDRRGGGPGDADRQGMPQRLRDPPDYRPVRDAHGGDFCRGRAGGPDLSRRCHCDQKGVRR